MPNENNIAPYRFTSDQSRDEAAKNGQIGGIASGVSRRRKKSLKATMRAILDLPVGTREDFARLAELGVDQEDYNNQTVMLAGLFRSAAKGNVKAVREIRSILQEQTETPLEAKERKLRAEKAAIELKATKSDPNEDAIQSFIKAVSPTEDDIKELFADEDAAEE